MFENIDVVIPELNEKNIDNSNCNKINAFSVIMQKNNQLLDDEVVELFEELLYFLDTNCVIIMKDEN